MKKVLIITYYWPPAGGPGVQRVLKFAKYLPEFGWQPIILTVKNGEYPAIDETLVEEIPECCKVFKTNSIEPSFLYKKFTGMKADEKIPVSVLAEKKVSWKKRLANWIRLNLFIPDAKIGWIPYAVKEGKKVIRKEKPDIIFSSSPPPTVHLIAKKLAKWSKIKWVADFRDPWMEMAHFQNTKRSVITRYIDSKYEKSVFNKAVIITTISANMKKTLNSKIGAKKVEIIPNGFDEKDFVDLKFSRSKKLTISYAGNLSESRIPYCLFTALKKIKKQDPEFDFEFKIMGEVCSKFIEEIERNSLQDNTKILGYLFHKDALEILMRSDVLLLVINNIPDNQGFVTGKLFEYLGCKKPIFAIGPVPGDANKILKETDSGVMIDYDDHKGSFDLLKLYYTNYKKDKNIHSFNNFGFDRKSLTKFLVDVFDKL
jgi:glycosyltransferase involved in cell wall biosynthesis